MGIIVDILNVKFFNEFKNDIGFVSNLSDFTINLTGSVAENVKVTQNVDVSWNSLANTADEWIVSSVDSTIIRTTGSFLTDGFYVGDEFDYIDHDVPAGIIFNGTIVSVSDLKISCRSTPVIALFVNVSIALSKDSL